MSVTPDKLRGLIRGRPDRAGITLPEAGPATDDTGAHVCWAQAVLAPDASLAERAQARAALRAAAAQATTARGWGRHVEVEEERTEGGRVLVTLYLFRAT